VAVWKLPVLKKDLVLTGEVMADIFASTSGSDGDIVVKLIDQYPDDDGDRPQDARLPADDQMKRSSAGAIGTDSTSLTALQAG
jgi:predicted acyl esterase